MAPTVLQSLDQQLEALFSQWNGYSSALAAGLVLVLFLPFFLNSEPDVHPFLLARQAAASLVRQPGESAVFRSLETPHGYPLRAGLGVKDEGAPRWAPGRDGDLRDIWREASKAGSSTKLIKLLGRLDPVVQEATSLTPHINAVGKKLQAIGVKRLAICLPNSGEFLVALFAAIFYDVTPILVPPGQEARELRAILNAVRADAIVGAAGSIEPEIILKEEMLKHVFIVVEESSRQMGWEGIRNTSIWHELVQGARDTELPISEPDHVAPGILHVWLGRSEYEVIEHSQKNVVAAVSAQLSCLPRAHRISSTDTILSLCPLTFTYPLVLTLAGLYAHATTALISSALTDAPYSLAFQVPRVQPTIVIASPETMLNYLAHIDSAGGSGGAVTGIYNAWRSSQLARGRMGFANGGGVQSSDTSASRLSNHGGPRLIFVPDLIPLSIADPSPPLSPRDMHALRLATRARLVHALTAPRVAGAIAQSHPLDYRINPLATKAHYGSVLSCVEVRVIDGDEPSVNSVSTTEAGRSRQAKPSLSSGGGKSSANARGWVGWLVASGPAVASDGKDEENVQIGVKARLGGDGTVSLV